MKVLVLCDDYWHPGEVIEKGIALLDEKDFTFDFVRDAKDILTKDYIDRYDVIVSCKGNSINGFNRNAWFEEGVTEVMPKDFRDYIEKGGGFISLHASNTSKEGDDLTDLIGNYFIGHPPRCDVEIEITGDHPITEGVNNFTVRDEHYNIKLVVEDSQELFKTKSETGGLQLGGYVRELGKGRLCVLTPGHILSVWEHEEFQKLLINSINWCGGSL